MKVTTQKEIIVSLRGEEAIILNLKNQRHYRLNSTAFRIWQLLEVYGNTEPTIEIMLQEYDVDANVLKEDLDELLTGLKEVGLVSIP